MSFLAVRSKELRIFLTPALRFLERNGLVLEPPAARLWMRVEGIIVRC